MGRWGIRGLETRVGWECSISRRRTRVYSRGIHVRGVQGATVLRQGAAPTALNLERKSCKQYRWTHLEQVQHCTDLPHQVTFPAHTKQGKMGAGLG